MSNLYDSRPCTLAKGEAGPCPECGGERADCYRTAEEKRAEFRAKFANWGRGAGGPP